MADSELGEIFGAMREESRGRREDHRAHAAAELTRLGATFTSHNHGAHLKVTTPGDVVDYWPGTGLVHGLDGVKRRIGIAGVRRLLGERA